MDPVATTTLLTGETTARRTTVFMKFLMATTGALFVFYVLMHMYGNLKIFAGPAAFDEYAEHLREILVPILPYSGFLWLFRALLVVSLVVHAYAAFTLWSRANGARPQRYAVKNAAKVNFNGAFSADKLKLDGHPSTGLLVIASFQLWWVVLIYLIALVALGMHLFHGVWSGAQTLGWTNSATSRRLAHTTAHLVAGIVVLGFAIPPLAILFGIVKG